MVRLIGDLAEDWRRLDERIATVSAEIKALAEQDGPCQRLMTVPGTGSKARERRQAAAGRAYSYRSATMGSSRAARRAG
jgi:transposase